ncbi:uncharacterized protein [Diadema antillarum]|uniref:uncharacterized protein n=1 Tax=Diadema antillarum TaxID=105358 RepID=UPI003A85F409
MRVSIILGLVIVYVACSEAQRNRCRNIQCNINSGPVCANGRRFPNDCVLRRSFCNRRQQFRLERCPTQGPRQPQQPWGQQSNNQRRQPPFNQGRPNQGWNNQGRPNQGWNNQGYNPGYNQGYNGGYNQQWYPSSQGTWSQGFADPEERQEALENQRENQQEMYENDWENQQEMYENERENQQEMYENQRENQEEGGMGMFQGGWYQNPNQNMGRYRGQQPGWRGNYNPPRRQMQPMWTSREQFNPMMPSGLVAGGDNDFVEAEELEFDGPVAQTAGGTTNSQETSSEEILSPGGSPGGSPGQSFSSPSDSVLSTGPFGSL